MNTKQNKNEIASKDLQIKTKHRWGFSPIKKGKAGEDFQIKTKAKNENTCWDFQMKASYWPNVQCPSQRCKPTFQSWHLD